MKALLRRIVNRIVRPLVEEKLNAHEARIAAMISPLVKEKLSPHEARIAATIGALVDEKLNSHETQFATVAEGIRRLESRIEYLDERLLSYYKNRWDVIDKLGDYLVGTQVPGDYLEFGVFLGKTFSYAHKIMAPLFPEMRFVALDSFEGLPEPKGVDATGNYTSGFFKGQFACAQDQFVANLDQAGVDQNRVVMVKGWFDESLHPGNPATQGLDKVAAAWIDCDLYESTEPVLAFLTERLSVGSVILFDDWRCYRNLADFGQQRACREWLQQNPQITLNPFVDFGFHGVSFTVRSC